MRSVHTHTKLSSGHAYRVDASFLRCEEEEEEEEVVREASSGRLGDGEGRFGLLLGHMSISDS